MHKLTNDRKKWGAPALLAGALLLVYALLIRPYLWVRLPGAVVTFDGKATPLAAVYQSPDGQLLLWIKDAWGGYPFIIYPTEDRILEAHGGSILNGGDYLVSSRFVWNRPDAFINGHLRGTSLYSPKSDIDPRVVFQPGSVEFTEEVTSPSSSPWITRRVRIKL